MASNKPRNVKLAFGQAVRKLRQQQQLSQEKLAELADIHRTYVGDVERGARNVSLVNMSKIASALGVSLSRLVREAEQ